MTKPLQGKTAFITGAGRGIGRAIAVGLARAGASVVCSARQSAEIAQTVRCIEADGGQALEAVADVTDAAALAQALRMGAERFGGIDIVVANAGVSPRGSLVDGDPGAWRQTINTNVIGVFHTMQAAVPWLRLRGGGKIIVVGSGAKLRASTGRSAYGASKAAVWMMVQTAGLELRDQGISVNELVPGPVRTAMTEFGTREIPDGEWLKDPEDVVPLALFLATHPEPGPTAQSFSLMRRV